jgi:hypothetical protein
MSRFFLWVFSKFCVVFLTWYVICRLVFLKILVTFRIMGIWYSNVTHFLLFCCVCELFYVLSKFLFIICLFTFSMIVIGYPFFLAVWWIVFISYCFWSCEIGNWCNPFMRNLYAANVCCMRWFELKCLVVLVVVGFRYMFIDNPSWFLLMSKSRKLIVLFSSSVDLNCMCLCRLFM